MHGTLTMINSAESIKDIEYGINKPWNCPVALMNTEKEDLINRRLSTTQKLQPKIN